jgi:hypothetical protein
MQQHHPHPLVTKPYHQPHHWPKPYPTPDP